MMFLVLLALVHLDHYPVKTLLVTCSQILSDAGFISPDLGIYFAETSYLNLLPLHKILPSAKLLSANLARLPNVGTEIWKISDIPQFLGMTVSIQCDTVRLRPSLVCLVCYSRRTSSVWSPLWWNSIFCFFLPEN